MGPATQDGKLRIYAMYLGMPDTKAALTFLKQEYGSYYGHSQTYQDGSGGIVNYSPKGITFQRFSPSGSFSITWNRAAAQPEGAGLRPGLFHTCGKRTLGRHCAGVQQQGRRCPAGTPCGVPASLPHGAADPGRPGGGPGDARAGLHPRAALPPAVSPGNPAPRGWGGLLGALVKFFADHPEETLRASYLRLRFGEVPHQYPAEDGTTIGFQGFPNQLHVWEGSISNPAAETRLTWPEVCLLAEQEIAHDLEQAALETPAEAPPMEAPPKATAETPPQEAVPEVSERPQPSGAVTQAGIDAAIQEWNGSIESKHAVVRYMKEHGREKDTAAWLRQEYGDDLPAFPVTAGGAAADVPWPRSARIAQLIREDRFYTGQNRTILTALTPSPSGGWPGRASSTARWWTRKKLDNDPSPAESWPMRNELPMLKGRGRGNCRAPPTVREIYRQYLPIVREKVLADKPIRTPAGTQTGRTPCWRARRPSSGAVFTIEDAEFLLCT